MQIRSLTGWSSLVKLTNCGVTSISISSLPVRKRYVLLLLLYWNSYTDIVCFVTSPSMANLSICSYSLPSLIANCRLSFSAHSYSATFSPSSWQGFSLSKGLLRTPQKYFTFPMHKIHYDTPFPVAIYDIISPLAICIFTHLSHLAQQDKHWHTRLSNSPTANSADSIPIT